jgi:hypothetical protein
MFTCTSTSTSTNKYVHEYMCVYKYVSSYKKDVQSISHVRNKAINFYLAKELLMRSSVYFICGLLVISGEIDLFPTCF